MFNEASKNGKLGFRKTPWAIGKFLRGWQMNVPQGHLLGADPKAFLDDVRPQIRKKLTEEVVALKGIKFQLALKISLRKDRPDGAEEYLDPVLRHKQEALMRAGEINEALDKALPASWSCSKSGRREAQDGPLIEWRHYGWTSPDISP